MCANCPNCVICVKKCVQIVQISVCQLCQWEWANLCQPPITSSLIYSRTFEPKYRSKARPTWKWPLVKISIRCRKNTKEKSMISSLLVSKSFHHCFLCTLCIGALWAPITCLDKLTSLKPLLGLMLNLIMLSYAGPLEWVSSCLKALVIFCQITECYLIHTRDIHTSFC